MSAIRLVMTGFTPTLYACQLDISIAIKAFRHDQKIPESGIQAAAR
jgi:hypothetical protein